MRRKERCLHYYYQLEYYRRKIGTFASSWMLLFRTVARLIHAGLLWQRCNRLVGTRLQKEAALENVRVSTIYRFHRTKEFLQLSRNKRESISQSIVDGRCYPCLGFFLKVPTGISVQNEHVCVAQSCVTMDDNDDQDSVCTYRTSNVVSDEKVVCIKDYNSTRTHGLLFSRGARLTDHTILSRTARTVCGGPSFENNRQSM